MEWVETTGRTIEEAKDVALDRLGVHADEAEFEVIEEPKTGLFGRLKSEARVRARVRPSTPRPKAGRRERTRAGRSKGGQGRGRGDGRQDREAKGSKGKDGGRGAGGSGSGRPPGDTKGEGSRGRGSNGGGSGRGGGSGTDGDGRRSGGEGTRRSTEGTDEGQDRSGARDQSTTREKDAVREELTLSEQAGVVEEFLAGLFDALDIDADINVSDIDEETAVVSAEGEDVGLVIGPRGRTLDAVQQLARTVVQRHTAAGTKGRVRVDVGGYAERRRSALEAFARETAESVIETGTSRALEPMNAADRKVVHDAVVDMDGVRTLSEGEDPRRRVVIVPADGD